MVIRMVIHMQLKRHHQLLHIRKMMTLTLMTRKKEKNRRRRRTQEKVNRMIGLENISHMTL